MKKHFNLKFRFIVIAFIVFVFLFPKTEVFGWNNGNDYSEDLGPDVSTIEWHFTRYTEGDGGLARKNPKTGNDFVQDDWEVNETYGWHEWVYNGTRYVVVAAATREYLEELPDPTYKFLDKKLDHIHYFHYGTEKNNWNFSTFQFQFVDNDDDTIYNGIVLDSCAVSMDPSNPGWNSTEWDGYAYGAKPENTQWLDVHVPSGYPEIEKYNKFNGKEIKLTSTGTFNNYETKNNKGLVDWFIEGVIFILNMLGDGAQILTNNLAQIPNEIKIIGTEDEKEALGDIDHGEMIAETEYDPTELTYTRAEIESNEAMQEQIQVSDNGSSDNENIIKEINLSNYMDNKRGKREIVYTESTEIPIITADIYSLSTNQIDLLNIDFFNTSNDNKDKFWNFFKGIVSGFSHVIIYIAAILMLGMIIWRSILLVASSLGDDPQGARESKEIMDGLLRAICIMVGIYVFMTLMMYFYQEILTLALNGKDSNYLIRVNVENVYSFNTNFIGYLKYLTLKSNVLTTLGVSFVYAAIAGLNLVWFGFMFFRMVIIGGLIIVAPMTAINEMLGRQRREGFHIDNIFHLRNWVSIYLRWLWTPLIVGVIMYKFLLCIG